jgi:hypothetical protein
VGTQSLHRRLLRIAILGSCLIGMAGCGSQSTGSPVANTAASGAAQASTGPSAPAVASAAPAAAASCKFTGVKFDPKAIDLTGTWAGDDGGVYFVRQRGNVVFWNGMSDRDGPPDGLGREWNNVGHGVIDKDLTLKADWMDVPRGGIAGYGTVNFKIGSDAGGDIQLVKTSETGTGRGDSLWTTCTAGFAGG